MARSLEAGQAEFQRVPIPELEEDWLELRRPYWNASLAACLFPDPESKTGSEHPYVSLGDACTEKLREDFEVHDEDRRKLFARGLAMEPYLRDVAREYTGLNLVKPTMMSRRGVIMSTPDAVDLNRDDVGVELKSTRTRVGSVCPRYWERQVQLQMWTEDWERVCIVYIDATLEVSMFEIYRDDDAIRMMVDRATEYINVLSLGEMPSGVQLSAGNVQAIWPRSDEDEVDLHHSFSGPLKEYLDARAAEKAAKELKEKARDKVVAELGPHAVATLGGVEVATYRTTKDRPVTDWKALAKDHPDVVAAYTETKPGHRTFRIKDQSVKALVDEIGAAQDVDW